MVSNPQHLTISQRVRDGPLIIEEPILIAYHAISMGITSSQNLRSIGRANGATRESLVKDHAFPSKPINGRRPDDSASAASQGTIA